MTWIALRIRPQCERRAMLDLRLAGIEYIAPHETIYRRCGSSRAQRACQRPLLPGYVLALLSKTPIPASHSILGIVIADGKPVPINQASVEIVRGLEALIEARRKPLTLAVRTAVTIKGGPMAGTRTVVDEIKGQLAKIKVQLMGKSHSVTVPVTMLEAA